MVDFLKSSDNEETAGRMEEPYHAYKIDSYGRHITGNAVFGYGGQHFTKEAKSEKQPISGSGNNDLFVADAVLDNRTELLIKLGIYEEQEQSRIADGSLMYLTLKRYGRESLQMFLGTYAFVYYDGNEITLAADAVGSRSLYYCREDGKLYFSTIIKPILAVREKQFEWNYRFFADYLSLNNLGHYTETEETPYLNVYKVAPGQTVMIDRQGIRKEAYWEPRCTELLKKSDEEIREEFIRLFDTCVSGVLRSAEKTGILLSGGLDSTSVACFAAPGLKGEGKLLYAYTSIPEKDYVSKEIPYYNTNERKMVEYTKAFLGNLSCAFLDMPGVNGFDGAEKFLKAYELPYKSLQNIRWIHEAAVHAARDGCRILLNGQYGNATISLGDFDMHFHTLLKTGHFAELVKEVKAMAGSYHTGRKLIYKKIISNIIMNLAVKHIKPDSFKTVYVNPDLAKRYNTVQRFKKGGINSEGASVMDFASFRPHIVNKKALMQIGELETHLSLSAGILMRDPTRDRRILEFCMRLPENQFVYNGTERRLVREYLKSYLPKEVIADYRHRGLQSADTVERLSKNWRNIYKECTALLEKEEAEKLLDLPKIKSELKAYEKGLPAGRTFEIMKLLYSVLLVKYAIIGRELPMRFEQVIIATADNNKQNERKGGIRMKEWNKPEIKELNVSDTEGFSWHATVVDGYWTSKDGTVTKPTYSGPAC
jgi:asparagine synthase (glutamine-hydrolysing)